MVELSMASTARRGDGPTDAPSPDDARLQTLLGDEYARAILAALSDGDRSTRELIEACEMSRPTIYRRLDALTSAGVIEEVDDARARPRETSTYSLRFDRFEIE
ncbi:MAG: ArsR/SmtB family transcription factor, partial [Halanaeroarchaeum sp.]